MKKKILILIVALAMIFGLVGCDMLGGLGGIKEVTVSFDSQGGSAVEDVKVSADNVADFVLPASPTREGYAFTGWYLDAEGTQAFDSLKADKASVKLYAGWKQQSKKEQLLGAWSAAGSTFTFAADETFTMNVAGQNLKGTYTIDDKGNVKMSYNAFGLAFPLTIEGTLADDIITVSLNGQRLQLVKAKQYNLFKLPDFDFSAFKGINTTIEFDCSKLNINLAYMESKYDDDINDDVKELVEVLANNSASGKVTLAIEKFDIKSVKELNAILEVKLDVETDYEIPADASTYVELALETLKEGVQIQIKQGVAYINIPEALANFGTEMFGALYGAASEGEETPVEEFAFPTKISIDLNKIEEAYKEAIEEFLDDVVEEAEEFDIQPYVDEINNTIDSYLALAASAGLDDQAVKDILKIVESIGPEESKVGNVTTYSYTQAKFEKAIDDIKGILTKYNAIIATIAGEGSDVDIAEVIAALDIVKEAVTINKLAVKVTEVDGNTTKVEGDIDVKVNAEVEEEGSIDLEIVANGSVQYSFNEARISFAINASEYTDLTDMVLSFMQD